MHISYYRTAAKSYMILADAVFEHDAYEEKMLLHNKISGLLARQVILEDGETSYWYEVTGMQSFRKQPEFQMISGEGFRLLFHGLCDLLENLERFFLNSTALWLSPDVIFYDRWEKRFCFCYVPGLPGDSEYGMDGLMEYLLQHVDHQDESAVGMAYEMYEYVKSGAFTIQGCQKILNRDVTAGQKVRKDDVMSPPIMEEAVLDAFDRFEEMALKEELEGSDKKRRRKERGKGRKQVLNEKAIPMKKNKGRLWNRKQDVCPEDAPLSFQELMAEARGERFREADHGKNEASEIWNQTVCFSDFYRNQKWEFHYVGDGMEQDFSPDHYPYLIGKDPDAVDGVLRADTISRVHACVQERDGQLYLEDYNSTNGTYVNGRIIPLNTEIKLEKGDQIVFATEEFTLRQTLKISTL